MILRMKKCGLFVAQFEKHQSTELRIPSSLLGRAEQVLSLSALVLESIEVE